MTIASVHKIPVDFVTAACIFALYFYVAVIAVIILYFRVMQAAQTTDPNYGPAGLIRLHFLCHRKGDLISSDVCYLFWRYRST